MTNLWMPSELKNWQTFIVQHTPLWLFILAPFLLFPSGFKVLALLGLPLLWWLNKREKGYFIRRTPFDWAIFVLLLMGLVSEYATFDLNFSIAKISGVLLHVAIFYTVVERVKTQRGLRKSLWLFMSLGIFVSLFGLLNTQWLFKIDAINQITQRFPVLLKRLPGAEGGISPNQLAGTLLLFSPTLLSVLWFHIRRKSNEKLMYGQSFLLWIGASVSIFTFLLTQSRGGWVGGIVALAILGSLLHRAIRWTVGIGGVGAVIAGGVIGWQKVGELLVSDTTEAVVGNLGSLGFRQEVWRAAIWGISDFPFTGMGMGTFREVSRMLYPMNISPTYDIAHAHNQFLQTGLDLGVPGLIAFIAMWLIAGYLLVQIIRHTKDAFVKSVAIGIAASLGGYFVYALSDTVALGSKPGFFLWWLFAFSVGLYQQLPGEKIEFV